MDNGHVFGCKRSCSIVGCSRHDINCHLIESHPRSYEDVPWPSQAFMGGFSDRCNSRNQLTSIIAFIPAQWPLECIAKGMLSSWQDERESRRGFRRRWPRPVVQPIRAKV